MSRRANPAWIGAFVVGAALLSAAGVLAFGSLALFADKVSYVAYFESSLAGLDVGAPVRFRGIQVGRVSQIYLLFDRETSSLRTPVVIDLQIGNVRFRDGSGVSTGKRRSREEARTEVALLVERGMRAELRQDSLVTGKLSVALDFFPDDPARYDDDGQSGLPELPTRRTVLARLFKSIEELPLEELVTDVRETFTAVRDLVTDERIDGALELASQTLQEVERDVGALSDAALATFEELRALLRGVDAQVAPVGEKAQATLEDMRALLASLETHVETLSTDVGATLDQARQALEPLEAGLGDDHRLPQRVAALVDELAQAARRVASLVDYLERHPESLIQGKK